MLKNKFKTLTQNFSKDMTIINKLWEEIELAHSEPNRYYHTLKHLEHIYSELQSFELDHTLEFAIFYHDIVYEIKKADNEEQSAKLCEKNLKLLTAPQELIINVTKLINETKTHEASNEKNALFLDADLAILGSNKKVYSQYIQNIRQEYALYSDNIYNKGRKKVLKSFLNKDKIYISDYFHHKYEKQAHQNIIFEYNSLI